jgi:hypothetical protein
MSKPYLFASPLVAAAVLAALSVSARAGTPTYEASDKKTVTPVVEPPPYEAGRGLITLEGPSGMFINPTSATLPKGAMTLQYCLFIPEDSGKLIGHGLMGAYGVTDWLEIGGIGSMVDINEPASRTIAAGGPLARIRLLKDEGWVPQVSVGAYARWGTHALNRTTTFLAAYKRFPISDEGFVRSVGFHAGMRVTWFDEDALKANSFNSYYGAEVQFPYRVYLVGEIGTKGNNRVTQQDRTPYSFGFQWRLGGVNLSVAGIQSGDQKNIGYYTGFALNHAF